MAKQTKTPKPAPAEAAETEFKDLGVIEFGIENFMRVQTVIVRPVGNVLELSGRNRQGKTSVLRALVTVFAGREALPSAPIRRGETESRVWVVLGKDGQPELTIEEILTLKEDGEPIGRKLTITPADGRVFKTPQALLDRLYDPIAFAPFEFVRRKPAEQLEVVKALVPGVDFAGLAVRRLELFNDRTAAGRDVARHKGRYESILVPAGTPDKEVDVSELATALSDAHTLNNSIEQRKTRRAAVATQIEQHRDGAEQKLAAARKLEGEAAALEKEADELQTKLDAAEALPDQVDTAAIQARLESANTVNARVRMLRDREAARADLREAEETVADLTEKIEAIDADKAKAIADANLPIPGLELGDTELLLNGLPLDQASGREKIEVGVRIGLAINPDLKLIIVEEGALLDDDGVDVLEALAREHGFLVVIERVTNGEKVGITIEDGMVVS